ncbi:hypothetical protein [Streptomyces sp. NPDC050121]|uniref:hypothetical protein n=1 Tax=Streptomyces sp. NPDC050121 TaxID=3365601 RepID=UPI00378BB198
MRLPAGTTAAEKAEAEAKLPTDTGTVVDISRFSQKKLDQIQDKVTARDWDSDADKYGVATSYDAATDKMTVYTDAPESVTKSLRDSYPGDLEFRHARLEEQKTRFGDAQPFWGGSALTGDGIKCTAGVTVTDPATEHTYLTTAGHCYSNLTHVYSRGQNGHAGNWVGQVTRRDRNIDTELMYADSASAYGAHLFDGGLPSSGSSVFVHGTSAPRLNTKVCVSGSVSLNHCGHPIIRDRYSICYGSGDCIKYGQAFVYARGGTNPPNYDNGQITQPGDSGAPIYRTDHTGAAAWIVGLHSGVDYVPGDHHCSCYVKVMVGVNIMAVEQGLHVEVDAL